MSLRQPLQNDLEPLLEGAGLSGGSIEVLLNLALGPARTEDLRYNAKLVDGEDVAAILSDLKNRGLVVESEPSDGRFRLQDPQVLAGLLAEPAGSRLALLAQRCDLDFTPSMSLNPALPAAGALPRPFDAHRRAMENRLAQTEVRVQTLCNIRCLYCFIRRDERDSRTLAEVERELTCARQGGIERLILTGGEPTIRKDLPEMIALARRVGFVDVQLFTNGLMFAYRDLLAACVEAGLTSVVLHLSTFDSKLYRRLTGRDHLATVLRAMDNLAQHPGLEMTVISVINRLNLAGMSETITRTREWQARAGFSWFSNQIPFCCVYSSSWDHRDEVLLPMDRVLPAVQEICDLHGADPEPLLFLGFPFCQIPGCEVHNFDLYTTLARQLLPGGTFDYTFLDTMFLKPKRCGACVHEPYCLGLSRGYARLYGSRLLEPVLNPGGGTP